MILCSIICFKKYMNQKKISPSLQAHVMEYLDYIWARKRSVNNSASSNCYTYKICNCFYYRNVHYHTLLNDMSFCMQADIAMAGTEGLLRQVKISNVTIHGKILIGENFGELYT